MVALKKNLRSENICYRFHNFLSSRLTISYLNFTNYLHSLNVSIGVFACSNIIGNYPIVCHNVVISKVNSGMVNSTGVMSVPRIETINNKYVFFKSPLAAQKRGFAKWCSIAQLIQLRNLEPSLLVT